MCVLSIFSECVFVCVCWGGGGVLVLYYSEGVVESK